MVLLLFFGIYADNDTAPMAGVKSYTCFVFNAMGVKYVSPFHFVLSSYRSSALLMQRKRQS
jgi:hypothetical protein